MHATNAGSETQLPPLDLLVEQHGNRVYRLALRLCHGHADAQDIAQDVFVVAIEQGSKFAGRSSVETWLCGITVRLCRRWGRRQAVKERFFSWAIRHRPLENADHSQRVQREDWLQNGLSKLSVRDREILVLHYLEQQSPEQIALILNANRSTIDQRLSRARKRLAQQLNSSESPKSP